jgi:hypothetical protein
MPNYIGVVGNEHADRLAAMGTTSAPTAWDFSQVLGNLGVDLGFGDFAMQSWDFYCREGKIF